VGVSGGGSTLRVGRTGDETRWLTNEAGSQGGGLRGGGATCDEELELAARALLAVQCLHLLQRPGCSLQSPTPYALHPTALNPDPSLHLLERPGFRVERFRV